MRGAEHAQAARAACHLGRVAKPPKATQSHPKPPKAKPLPGSRLAVRAECCSCFAAEALQTFTDVASALQLKPCKP
eukprot:354727-Chlamydomonas_euryale.AAC.10